MILSPGQGPKLATSVSTWLATGVLLVASAAAQTSATPAEPKVPAVQWVRTAAEHEVHIIEDDGTFPVRYISHRRDSRGASLRITIESRQGTVSRTMYHDGRALTPEEHALERKRLQEILDDTESWSKKQRRNTAARSYATALVKLMPDAMLYTYAPGQPQAGNGSQVVIDFKPDPTFHPPTLASELLTGLEGRMWIDTRSSVLVRVEGRIVQPVNFGWGGLFARFYPGGTIEFEQADAGNGRWVYSNLDEKVTVREFLVHTHAEDTQVKLSEIHLLPQAVNVDEAVRMLLALPDTH